MPDGVLKTLAKAPQRGERKLEEEPGRFWLRLDSRRPYAPSIGFVLLVTRKCGWSAPKLQDGHGRVLHLNFD